MLELKCPKPTTFTQVLQFTQFCNSILSLGSFLIILLFLTGTTERVCLIKGTTDSVMSMLTFICEKIREKPDPNAKPAMDFDSKTPAERDKQVKILVPNSTAGKNSILSIVFFSFKMTLIFFFVYFSRYDNW